MIPEEEQFWDGSIDKLKSYQSEIENLDVKKDYEYQLKTLIHMSRMKHPETSHVLENVRTIFNDFFVEFIDINAKVREDFLWPPHIFDYLTKQTLTEQELVKYNLENQKKRDDYIKKAKKKPLKPDEEKKEIEEYNAKFPKMLTEHLVNKFSDLETADFPFKLDEYVLESNSLADENYVDRLNRIKSFKSLKTEGIEGKAVVVRIDVQDYEHIYEEYKNEDGTKERVLKEVIFGKDGKNLRESLFVSTYFLLENRAKYVMLIGDWGPKYGKPDDKWSFKHLYDFVQRVN